MNEESQRQETLAKRLMESVISRDREEDEEPTGFQLSDILSDLEEARRYNPPLFSWEDETQEYLLFWSGHAYSVDIDTIGTPLALLGWVSLIGDKGWPLTTPARLSEWIDKVCERRGWNLPK